jgi:general stress protein YciG
MMAGTTMGGKKAAKTRGHESLSQAGRKGAQSLSHDQRVEIGKKAAETRGHESLSQAGRKGGEHSHRDKE